jgi:hypothetical protein
MKNVLLLFNICIILACTSVLNPKAYSQGITWNPIPIPGANQSDNSYQQNQQEDYKSNTGTRYQYDLNKPSDRVRYNADPAAQLRDRLNTNPSVNIDKNNGQYGGGVKNN